MILLLLESMTVIETKDCLEDGGNSYNHSWGHACRDGGFNESQCSDFLNNPVDEEENRSNCANDGLEHGKANSPFNKDRASACSEYGGVYTFNYKIDCENDNYLLLQLLNETETCNSQDLLYRSWCVYARGAIPK